MKLISMILSVLILQVFAAHSQHTSIVINGNIQTDREFDTIQLIIRGEFSHGGDPEFSPLQSEIIIAKEGRFSFTVSGMETPVKADFYIRPQRHPANNILLSENQLLYVPVEPGDSVYITGKQGALSFTGRGAANWAYRQSSDSLMDQCNKMKKGYRNADGSFARGRYDSNVVQLNKDLLKSYKPLLGNQMYFILEADRRSAENNQYLIQAHNLTSNNVDHARKAQSIYETYIHDMPVDTTNAALLRWSDYPYTLRLKASLDYEYEKMHGRVTEPDLYTFVAKRYQGVLLEKILMWVLNKDILLSNISDEKLAFMEANITIPEYRERIKMLKKTYATGSEMSDFEFRNKSDKPVRLSDFKGKVVLLDMWFTGCGGCVAVADSLPDVENAFGHGDSVVFISLSIDIHRGKWLRSVDPNKRVQTGGNKVGYTHYTTPSTVYLYTGGSGSHNPFIRKYVPGGAYPHLLLLGKDGKVYASDPPNPSYKGGKERLKALIRKALVE